MKCFYHEDVDGKCAGAIVAYFEKDYNPEDFFQVNYVQDLPIDNIKNGERVYFVDYAFTEPTKHFLDELVEKYCDIIHIDHHISTMNLYEKYPFYENLKGIRSDSCSGAALTWMWFKHCSFEDCPLFIKFVSDYDCWQFVYKEKTNYFKLGVEGGKYNALDDIWNNLIIESEESDTELFDNLLYRGKIIRDYVDENNTIYRNSYSYETEINGLRCLAVNKKCNSWVFGKYYDKYPIVMVWAFNGEKYVYSIFSGDPNVDCSKIAESYGGGGHQGAAGFALNDMPFKKMYERGF